MGPGDLSQHRGYGNAGSSPASAQNTNWGECMGMAASWGKACTKQSVLQTGEDKSAEETVEADV